MEKDRGSNLEEFALWYLARESRKSNGAPRPVPTDAEAAVALLESDHRGKWCGWYAAADWSVVKIESEDEFGNLIFLDNDWTKDELLTVDNGPDYRLLRRVAQRAIDVGYLARTSATGHREYYQRLLEGYRISGDERIMIRTPTDERRRNPTGDYYLQDGVGRCLPYMMLLLQGRLSYAPVEAFLARGSASAMPSGTCG